MGGGVGAGAGNHLAAAPDVVHGVANEVQPFGIRHGCGFSCGAADHQGGDACPQLPVQQLVIDLQVDKIQPKGGDQGGADSLKQWLHENPLLQIYGMRRGAFCQLKSGAIYTIIRSILHVLRKGVEKFHENP